MIRLRRVSWPTDWWTIEDDWHRFDLIRCEHGHWWIEGETPFDGRIGPFSTLWGAASTARSMWSE